MVQAPSTAAPAMRSDGLRDVSSLLKATERNCCDFKKFLSGVTGAPGRRNEVDPEALPERLSPQVPESRFEGSDPISATLAPEEPLSGGRALDPAEWLSSFGHATLSQGDGSPASPDTPSAAAAGRSNWSDLAQLVEGWVRKLAVGGDQRRAVARLDIGQGTYAGAELIIATEPGGVTVKLTLPEGTPGLGLGERLRARLAARGYTADVAVESA